MGPQFAERVRDIQTVEYWNFHLLSSDAAPYDISTNAMQYTRQNWEERQEYYKLRQYKQTDKVVHAT